MRIRLSTLSSLCICLSIISTVADAQVERLVLGRGGLGWRDALEQAVGLDLSTVALQPLEIDPSVNLAIGPRTEKGEFTNIFGTVWRKGLRGPPGSVSTDGSALVIGYALGDPTAVIDGLGGVSSSEQDPGFSFDLGLQVPLHRIRYFGPSKGKATVIGHTGQLLRDLFPRQYIVSASQISPLFLVKPDCRFCPPTQDLDVVLARSLNNTERVVDLSFATQFLRFLRFRWPTRGYVAEIEFYGEGYLPQTKYISGLFDLGEPVNFGRLLFDFERFRSDGFGSPAVSAPDADVRVEVEVRSGRDDTPAVYHIVSELASQRLVSEADFLRAPAGCAGAATGICVEQGTNVAALPGQRGNVLDDIENWSFWSAPQQMSGDNLRAPDGRQYLQVRGRFLSAETFAFGRLNSLTIEYSPLLAHPVWGEIAHIDDPEPLRGVVEVPIGTPVNLTYDVRADFTSSNQTGFNAVRVVTPESVILQGFQMGEPLADVEPDSVSVGQHELVVYFPSRPVTELTNQPLRLIFSTRVFNFITEFQGEVFHTDRDELPQSIDSGNASPSVSSNDLRVFAPQDRLAILGAVHIDSKVVTPNDDGANDEFVLSYSLHGVSMADVDVSVYDLTGRLVRRLTAATQAGGAYTARWDGTDAAQLVAPGMYVARIAVQTDLGTSAQMRLVAIAY